MKTNFNWTSEEIEIVVDGICRYYLRYKKLPTLAEFNASKDIQNGIAKERRKPWLYNSRVYELRKKAVVKMGLVVGRGGKVNPGIINPPEQEVELTATKPVEFTKDPEVLVVTQDIMVEMSHLFDEKLAPLLAMVKKSEKLKPLDENPLVSIPDKTPSTLIAPTPLAENITEERVRAIFIEEIERIFGPVVITHPTPESNQADKKPPVVKTSEAEKEVKHLAPVKSTVITPADIKPLLQPAIPLIVKVFVYGLTREQALILKKGLDDHIQIESSPVYNDSSKSNAKNADLVVVSRFCTHSIHDAIKNNCGTEKVFFASGGISMIRRMIKEQVKKLETAS